MLISIFFSFLRAGSRIITSLERAHRRFAVQALRSRAVDKNKSAKGARRFGRARARVGAPHRSGLLALFCRSRLSACGTTVLHLLLKLAASHARTVARVSCVLRAIDAERHGFCKMIEKGIRSSCVDAGRCKGRYFFFLSPDGLDQSAASAVPTPDRAPWAPGAGDDEPRIY